METLATVSEIARIGLGPMGPFVLFGLVAIFLALLAVWAIGEQKADPVTKLEGKAKNLTWVSNPSGQSALRDNKQNELLEKYASFLEPEDLSELSEMRKKLEPCGISFARCRTVILPSTGCFRFGPIGSWDALLHVHGARGKGRHSVDCEICNRARCLGISISKVEIK